MPFLLGIVFLLGLAVSSATAATITLNDCVQATVQAAVNNAIDGDTIVCPAGSWSWASTVTINNKNLKIQGAGRGLTTLTNTSSAALFTFAASHTKGGEISGFSLRGGAVTEYGLVRFAGGRGWRIHHNEFSLRGMNQSGSGEGNSTGIYTSYQGASNSQLVEGLIDRNVFNTVPGYECSHAFLYIRNRGVNNATLEFSLPSQVRTGSNTLFVEDNTFTHGNYTCGSHQMHTLTTHAGAFVVFRHNAVTNGQIDFHGYCGTDGTREYQITDNTFNNTVGGLYRWINVRGGTGYIANNTRTGAAYTRGIDLAEYRLTDPSGSCNNSALSRSIRGLSISPPNTCCNQKEGSTCIGQVGTGQVMNGEQLIDPLYIFNNSGGSVQIAGPSSQCGGANPADFIRQDIHYILAQKASAEYTYPHPRASEGPPPGLGSPRNLRIY